VGDHAHHDRHGHDADHARREHGGDPAVDSGRRGGDPGPGTR
jgi:hypothetical protein